MPRLTINVDKLKKNDLWIKINRVNDPTNVVNVDQWDKWKSKIITNPVVANLPIKTVARFIARPWPDEMGNDTLLDHLSLFNVAKQDLEIRKTIILSIATVAIGYAGNTPEDYEEAANSDNISLLYVLANKPVVRLLTPDSWKSWQKTIASSRLMQMRVEEIVPYIGIATTPELAKVKISALIKMTLSELKSKYSTYSLDIIALSLGTLSVIIKLNIKYDSGTSEESADLGMVILKHHDALKEMFSK